jgi:hypothetical protein
LVRCFAQLPLLAIVASDCHGCRDHPYVPYTIDAPGLSASASAEAGPPPSSTAQLDAGRSSFSGEPAAFAPAGLAHWSTDGLTLEAPPGMVFVSSLVRDFDGDGANDAFAIVRPPDANDPGELVLFRGSSLGTPIPFAPPRDLVRDASCTPVDRLVLVGPRAVLVELGVQCPQHAPIGPLRWVAVLEGAPSPRPMLGLTIADPVGAPVLSVDAEVTDRDNDGRDDVALRVSLEGGGAPLEPGPRVSATFAWLDRPAGLSRDASATESSFASLGATANARAMRSAEASSVPGYVAQARALWRATCANGGSPRLVPATGTSAIPCGGGRPLEELGLAEVHAYVTMGDSLRACLAFDRAERAPATQTKSRVKDAQGWIAQVAPVATARTVRSVSAVPATTHGHESQWGALAFESSGKLLVRTRAGVVRVDPDQGDEAAANDITDWKSSVTSPDGAFRWIETYDPCDGLPLRATFAPSSGDDMRDLALPVVPPLGGRCAGSRGAPARALAVAWGAGGLEAIVEGRPVLVAPDLSHASALATFLDQAVTMGAPRSPDGKTYVVPTSAGLVVRGPGKARLLRASELEGTYADQHDCVVSNDATHVACARAGKAWVGTWEGS